MLKSGNLAASIAAATLVAACATAPEPEGDTIYFDPETGVAYTDEDASEDAKELAAQLEQFSQADTPTDLEDDEIWETDVGGNLTHIQSGFICPALWNGMQRTSEAIYNRQGQDVGCNYGNTDGAVVTLYAYRSRMTVADEVTHIMDTIVKARNPVHEESSIPEMENPNSGFSYKGDAIIFAGGGGTPMKSGLALMETEGWRIKARVTYPLAVADEIERFVGISLLAQHDRVTERARQLRLESAPDDTI